ncbi:MAG: phosphoenolpyruvate--protein phosphotransferase [Pyrinomonadaceae bacterium]
MILEDRKLLEAVESHIERESVNAEWALKVVSDRLLDVYAKIKDDYLRERGSDVEDVVERLLFALSGERTERPQLMEDTVIVAEELLPSTVAELDFGRIRAIATDSGGWTSHTAIIARGLGIPAVVGLRDFYRQARTGDEIIVDAGRGEIVLHPTVRSAHGYRSAHGRKHELSTAFVPVEAQASAHEPLVTVDGVEIILRANLELPPEYAGIDRFGARGVGLFRTEFMLSQRDSMPLEEEQYQAYLKVAQLGGADGAILRLFDLGGDKGAPAGFEPERNPALGLRGIRFCLRHEELFRTQVRAVLRAGAQARVSAVVPMVSDVTDMRRARALFDEERARLTADKVSVGRVRLGAMIEVPAAVMLAAELAREVDFLSLGTNDLVQYLLAVDRDNDQVSDWFRSLHPAVLQSVRKTISAAVAAAIPIVVCGEMAASPAYALILIGLGARELSMSAASIPRVRRMVKGIDELTAAAIADDCLKQATADDVEELVRVRLGSHWPELFPPKSLPAARAKAAAVVAHIGGEV